MGQANTPLACPISFVMTRKILGTFLVTTLAVVTAGANAQDQKTSPNVSAATLTAERAVALAEQGRCKEAMPALRKAVNALTSKEERKKAGFLGVRCALFVDDRVAAGELLGQLAKQFPSDPDVLYMAAHAYSDLSMRAAGELAQKAPRSIQARRMNAEALELQGRWDEAAKEYEAILEENPKQPGIHFLIARVLFSKPNAGPDAEERAKQELEKELEIDPHNAGAEFILGEIAKKASDWSQAIAHFSRAAAIDPNFGDAFMEWGFALISSREYEKAVAPLQAAVRMQPGNPSAHYNLGMALSRTGRTAEAEKEFAVQKAIIANLNEKKNAQTELPKSQ
jgi:tetratricopeptide (TPR) repeat protein